MELNREQVGAALAAYSGAIGAGSTAEQLHAMRMALEAYETARREVEASRCAGHDLLRRYMRLVINEEGWDFLRNYPSHSCDVKFSPPELKTLRELSEEARR